MANEQKKTATASPAKPQAPKGFAQVTFEAPSYSAETCEGQPAQGKLIDCIDMPDAKDDNGQPKAWSALVLIATAPTVGTKLDGTPVSIAVGDKFTIGMGKALEDLAKLAVHPTAVYEVWMMPGEKRKIANSAKTFVPWDIHVNPKADPRPAASFSLKAALNTNAPQLPAASNGASAQA